MVIERSLFREQVTAVARKRDPQQIMLVLIYLKYLFAFVRGHKNLLDKVFTFSGIYFNN